MRGAKWFWRSQGPARVILREAQRCFSDFGWSEGLVKSEKFGVPKNAPRERFLKQEKATWWPRRLHLVLAALPDALGERETRRRPSGRALKRSQGSKNTVAPERAAAQRLSERKEHGGARAGGRSNVLRTQKPRWRPSGRALKRSQGAQNTVAPERAGAPGALGERETRRRPSGRALKRSLSARSTVAPERAGAPSALGECGKHSGARANGRTRRSQNARNTVVPERVGVPGALGE